MIIGVALIADGLIHLIGFVVQWKTASLEGFPYRTDVLSDAEIGTTGVKALGFFWLVAAFGFVIVGVAHHAGQSWWWRATLVVAAL